MNDPQELLGRPHSLRCAIIARHTRTSGRAEAAVMIPRRPEAIPISSQTRLTASPIGTRKYGPKIVRLPST